MPVIYCNDNFGKWRSDFRSLLAHVLNDDVRGQPIAELLAPEEDDYFVLKPKHSGFHSTSLDVLLAHLGATTLILTGIAGNFWSTWRRCAKPISDFPPVSISPGCKKPPRGPAGPRAD